jgi:hypothetical protein
MKNLKILLVVISMLFIISGCSDAETNEITENCTNLIDDDGDGYIDCDDQDCKLESVCNQGELCNNGKDDDGDNHVDCLDQDCIGYPGCSGEICDNLQDDDNDGFIDCKDQDCDGDPICDATAPENCVNEEDDDGDNLVDCDDPDCATFITCLVEDCDNGDDDDQDGAIDCDDTDCASFILCQDEICDNEEDDNGNGYIDCEDVDCASFVDCAGTENCINQEDDDGDNLTDCNDPDCDEYWLCQIIPSDCDPVYNVGCGPIYPPTEETCYYDTNSATPFCQPTEGTIPEGDVCNTSVECAPGNTCYGFFAKQCLKLCHVETTIIPECGQTSVCMAIPIGSESEYGICFP